RRGLLAAGAAGALITPRGVFARQRPYAWGSYASDLAATKYAPLDLINADNANRLGLAWQWDSPGRAVLNANPQLTPGEFQSTPIFAENRLIVSTAMSQIAALDPRTGQTLWLHDPGSWRAGPNTTKGFLHRGVAVWGEGAGARII